MPSSVKGTFNYMAPEAFEPPFGIEVDIWSLGCVLVEMATGTPPWADLQMQAIMMAVAVRQQAPEVPDAMPAVEVVRQCFAFTPSARPTAQCLAEALRSQVAALTLTLTATQKAPYSYQEVQQHEPNPNPVTSRSGGLVCSLCGRWRQHCRWLKHALCAVRSHSPRTRPVCCYATNPDDGELILIFRS